MSRSVRSGLFPVAACVLFGAAAVAQEASEVRGTKVVPERPARVFVMAAFDDACKSVDPVKITITAQPAQGLVTLRPGQETTVQYSVSGKCIGSRVVGTGIYYTARSDAAGADTFAVAAQIGSGEPVTRKFDVRIASD
jgi:hypothetical protein